MWNKVMKLAASTYSSMSASDYQAFRMWNTTRRRHTYEISLISRRRYHWKRAASPFIPFCHCRRCWSKNLPDDLGSSADFGAVPQITADPKRMNDRLSRLNIERAVPSEGAPDSDRLYTSPYVSTAAAIGSPPAPSTFVFLTYLCLALRNVSCQT